MDLATITRSIEEVATISKAAGAKVDSQIAEILKHTSSSDARILDLEQKILTRGAGPGPGAGGPLNLGALLAGDAKLTEFRAGNAQRIQSRFPRACAPFAGRFSRTRVRAACHRQPNIQLFPN